MSDLFVAHVRGPSATPSFVFVSGGAWSSRYRIDHVRSVRGGFDPRAHEHGSHTQSSPGQTSASASAKPGPNWSDALTARSPTAVPQTAHGASGAPVSRAVLNHVSPCSANASAYTSAVAMPRMWRLIEGPWAAGQG